MDLELDVMFARISCFSKKLARSGVQQSESQERTRESAGIVNRLVDAFLRGTFPGS